MKDSKKISVWLWLLTIFLFLSASVLLLKQTRTRTPKDDYEQMYQAAVQADKAFAAIRKERLHRGHSISPVDDPCNTGLIGDSYTEITTTLGSLEAKRSSTNPNTAAMVVELLNQCNVKKGDLVAVNLSSSFPAMNIAVLCALDSIGADGIIINSVGASTYGANLPDFTYLDMEQLLLNEGIIKNHTTAFSLGGADDIGREMPEEIKNAIIHRLKDYGLTFLYEEDLNENIAARQAIYEAKGTPVCFINAGGNLLSFGGGTEMISAHNGLILPGQDKLPSDAAGLIPLYLEKNIPVIHLLNMKSLLPANGLPFDPQPLPKPGEGDVYTSWHYNRPLAALLLMGGLGMLILLSRYFPKKRMPL